MTEVESSHTAGNFEDPEEGIPTQALLKGGGERPTDPSTEISRLAHTWLLKLHVINCLRQTTFSLRSDSRGNLLF